MPSYAAVGTEFLVNNVTLYTQSRADLARLANGGFVAVWESTDGQQDASSGGLKGRVMGFDGTPIGPEFLINTATANAQTYVSVAGLSDGGFVVTWATRDGTQDGSYDSIKAQRFDASGAKVGSEFLVNSFTNNIQWIPAVASLDNGGFVIAWETYDSAQDGSSRAIKAQCYDAAGVKVGGEFLVNTVTAGNQMGPEISTLSGGRFIVTWQTEIAGKLDVRAQVFNSSGAKIGGEILVNSLTAESQTESSVTNLANGGFVITWTTFDTTQDGSGYAVKAQVFDAAGAKVGTELLVNTATAASQKAPSVAGLSNGDFVIAWRTDDQTADNSSGAIKAQVFSSTGAKIGTEFLVNTTPSSLESDPIVVDLGNGAFAIGWTGSPSPTYDSNIKAQIYSSGSAPVIQSNGGGAAAAIVVAEGTTAVTDVNAADLDGPATGYSIAGGADAALFTINAATGLLAFAVAPDFAAPADADGDNVYEVVVRASDGSLADEQALSVHVESANQAVAITSDGGGDSAILARDEGETLVTTVTAVDGDGDPISYAIAGGTDADRFTIDATTGVLAFRAAPNREAPTDADADNVYQVIVQASDGALVDTQSLAVTVGNLNEAPSIIFYGYPASESIISSMPEGYASASVFSAIDPDGDAIAWTLSGVDAALFAFDPASGVLSFVATPDYEAPGSTQGTNSYYLTLTVGDGTLTDSVAIAIHIRSVNETLAITSLGGGDEAAVTIDEGAAAATVVSASDIDGDVPAYAIAGGADAALFTIDAATGALAFLTAPDFEAPADADGDGVYSVVVSASDGSFTDSQSIAVTVANVNEAVTITGFGDTGAIAMSEDAVVPIAIEAVDGDGDSVSFALSGADAARFVFDTATGTLSFAAAPDHEAPASAVGTNVYAVTVTASDGSLTDSVDLAIEVTNANEAIAFTSFGGADAAEVLLDENAVQVATLAAADADGDAPYFAIAGGADAALFTIDAVTGALAFLTAPSFEAPADADGDGVYAVVVSASDGSLTDSQAIAVTVANVNEAVTITGFGDTGAIAMAEDAVVPIAIEAVDGDGDSVSFALSGADAARFVFDAATGTLTFAAAPDHEAPASAAGTNVYAVTVTASDGSLTDSVDLAIEVTNANEAIAFTSFGGADAAEVLLDENAIQVATLAAADVDGDTPSFAIAGGADAALFTIDAATGALALLTAPSFEAPADADGDGVYAVVVSASDGSLTDSLSIAVTVADLNEGLAITSLGGGESAAVTIGENDTAVATVSAVDEDGDPVGYAIVGGADADRFVIDGTTGALAFVAAPDFESPADADGDGIYSVVVAATDSQLADTQSIAVTVANVNEAVTITGFGDTGAIAMAEDAVVPIAIEAVDGDGDSVSFALSGADAARFVLDAATGTLSFAGAPDHEAPASAAGTNVYAVTVTASDGSLTDSVDLAIEVTNVNEGIAFTSFGGADAAEVWLNENIAQVTTLAAADVDGDAPYFAIAGGADAALFTIDSATGALRFDAAPNHEAPADAGGDNVYDVIVSADDGSFVDTMALQIAVANVRDGATVFGTSAANTITTGSAEDTIFGMGGSDTLNGGAGDDRIDGGSGSDRIVGGLGADELIGGAGIDRFAYASVNESAGAALDSILDFVSGQDRIDLSMIDARTTAGGNQAFAFIGSAGFGAVAGQLRYESANGDLLVMGDINGDAAADFVIRVESLTSLSSGDFIL